MTWRSRLAALLVDDEWEPDVVDVVVDRHFDALRVTGYDAPIEQRSARRVPRGLELSVVLVDGSNTNVATMYRTFDAIEGAVHHELIMVERQYRGETIAARACAWNVPDYRHLGYSMILLRASMESGRVQWARFGFQFLDDEVDLRGVRAMFLEHADAAQIATNDVEMCRTPLDFYLLGQDELDADNEPSRRTLDDWGLAFDIGQDRRRTIASGYVADRRVHAGHALLAYGPSWNGFIDLDGVDGRRLEMAALNRMIAKIRDDL